ncbi:DNA-binding NarL/FixJ family response regulator [Streptomyces sp. SAI-208]|uniref:LuxR C-terminal-related transcriptional regulator n=1 Tax=Streptomyces sp. SAI-208 TaxID=2940550 RepID=UPI0024733905|nr:hypothetical protein [Streptomyces sp. SAI-208]MDH6604522.1 DNA-binding NarL/FixJ family response regulator [Streptomyces sp. SAI-208]
MTLQSSPFAGLRLTTGERRVAEQIVAGATNHEGALALEIRPGTFSRHVSKIGAKTNVASRPARAHVLLSSGQVPPPAAAGPVPPFDAADRRLIRALAEHSNRSHIAKAAGIAPSNVGPYARALVAKADAANVTHLIGLAHAWGLFADAPHDSGSAASADRADKAPMLCAARASED